MKPRPFRDAPSCEFCFHGWRYELPYGWVDCASDNDGKFEKPSDKLIGFWLMHQPKLEKVA